MSDGEADNGEPADARDLFAWLSREVHELVSHVPRVHGAPRPIQFLRDFVSANRPVVVTDAFNDWPAMERWSLDYLADAMGDTKISVNVTP
jgi:jumonji domain-containing protein 7